MIADKVNIFLCPKCNNEVKRKEYDDWMKDDISKILFCSNCNLSYTLDEIVLKEVEEDVDEFFREIGDKIKLSDNYNEMQKRWEETLKEILKTSNNIYKLINKEGENKIVYVDDNYIEDLENNIEKAKQEIIRKIEELSNKPKDES